MAQVLNEWTELEKRTLVGSSKSDDGSLEQHGLDWMDGEHLEGLALPTPFSSWRIKARARFQGLQALQRRGDPHLQGFYWRERDFALQLWWSVASRLASITIFQTRSRFQKNPKPHR
jgi:hypothetical protein